MDDLLAGRLQMAISLAFHIIFASIGIAMPFLMAVAHWRWLRTGREIYKDLTLAWMKGVALFFATGAVSGTVLSFELGLLWPHFMAEAGAIIGMPFSWEGTAFFVEAIALGVYLYGWDRVKPWVHWAMGLLIGISGVASAIFVVAANAWMNSPAGFRWVDGKAVDIDPWAAMFNAALAGQATHMVVAAFQATGFAVAGLHAWRLLKHPQHALHQAAMRIALAFAIVSSLIQPLVGDFLAKDVAVRQPIKLAAMEAHFETTRRAPLIIGGWPDTETETVSGAIALPGLLSILAFGSPEAEVKGLRDFPRDEWPPVLITHLAFQVMVGLGSLMAVASLVYAWWAWRRPERLQWRPALRALALLTPAGFLALEAGWVVTEVGRQPWIIYGVMRTQEALTPMPGLIVPMLLFSAIYLLLFVILVWLMARHIRRVEMGGTRA